jgi:hypothetical protein
LVPKTPECLAKHAKGAKQKRFFDIRILALAYLPALARENLLIKEGSIRNWAPYQVRIKYGVTGIAVYGVTVFFVSPADAGAQGPGPGA